MGKIIETPNLRCIEKPNFWMNMHLLLLEEGSHFSESNKDADNNWGIQLIFVYICMDHLQEFWGRSFMAQIRGCWCHLSRVRRINNAPDSGQAPDQESVSLQVDTLYHSQQKIITTCSWIQKPAYLQECTVKLGDNNYRRFQNMYI